MIPNMILCDGPCRGHVPADDLEECDGRALCSACREGHREWPDSGGGDDA